MACTRETAADPVLVEISLRGREFELYVPSTQSVGEAAFILEEVLVDNCYFKHGIQVSPGATVIDIGAHIGAFGVKALSAVPNGDITYIGVEPCPPTFKALQHNLLGCSSRGAQSSKSLFHYNEQFAHVAQAATTDRSSTPYPGNIHLFNVAISAQPGTLPITYYPNLPSNSTLSPAEKQRLQGSISNLTGAQTFYVPVLTLDQLLQQARVADRKIDLIKIDVEGAELDVLLGLRQENWSNVEQIVVEVHDVLLDDTAALASCAGSDRTTPLPAGLSVNSVPHQVAVERPPEAATTVPTAETELIPPPVNKSSIADDGCDDLRAAPMSPSMASEAAISDPYEQADLDNGSIMFVATNALDVGPAGTVRACAPPPRPHGRVMQVACLLRDLGFKVVIECGLLVQGVAVNYNVYARKLGIQT